MDPAKVEQQWCNYAMLGASLDELVEPNLVGKGVSAQLLANTHRDDPLNGDAGTTMRCYLNLLAWESRLGTISVHPASDRSVGDS